jgi:hypothetical protein
MIKGKVDSMENIYLTIKAIDPHGGSAQQSIVILVVPSFSYIATIILEIFGPIVSIISAINYRYLIYLYFFKKKYTDYKIQ